MKRKQVSNAPGWDAIDGALARLYPGVEPMHLATLVSWQLGGDDPLDGISIYPRDDHWHFVSYGMSELYTKTSELAEQSGWGFEFTVRVARAPGEREAPMWAANLLQNLGRYVFKSGNWFDAGHQMDLNGPIALNRPDTALRAIAFADDPELGEIETPFGSLRFLQVVGLTEDEYASTDDQGPVSSWDAEGRQPADRARFGRVGVEDVRSLPSDERRQPADGDGVPDRGDLTVQLRNRDDGHPPLLRHVRHRALAVRELARDERRAEAA